MTPFYFRTVVSPQLGESKTVLDSGFQAMDFGFQVLDLRFFISATWILYSLSCIPDSKSQNSGFICQVKYNKISLEFRLNDKILVSDL